MSLLSSIGQRIGTLWRGVLGAVTRGQSSQVTAINVERTMQEAGVTPPADLAQAVDQMAGYASDWVNAALATAIAPDEAGITPAMVATAPWSMDLNEFNTSPAYHVVIGIGVEGMEETVWRTITGVSTLPGTVGGLRDLAMANAQALSVGTTPGGGVGGTVSGIRSIAVTIAPPGAGA